MNKKLLLPVLVILSAMLLSPVLVSASSTEYKFNGKIAYACLWPVDADSNPDKPMLILVVEGMMKPPDETPCKGTFMVVCHPSKKVCVKELDPNEFKWSFGACRVSTEVHGCVLTVEWCTEPPTKTFHEDEWIKVNGAWRCAPKVTAYCDKYVMHGFGLVARGTGWFMPYVP